MLSNTNANAFENQLHSITLEKNNTGYNVILDTDKMPKISKKMISEDELVLNLNGITSSETVNALYKGTKNINGLIIENTAPERLKIHINAEDIKNSTVMIKSAGSHPTIVGESLPTDKIAWAMFVLALFAVIFKISKDIIEDDEKVLIKKDIKDREIQMYRKYREEMSLNPSYNSRNSLKMKKMLKKIDRKIDERLTTIK